MMQQNNNLIEYLNNNEQAKCLLLVSLISTDTLINAESCEKSLLEINKLIDDVSTANIPEEDKADWYDRLETSKRIVEQDLLMYETN